MAVRLLPEMVATSHTTGFSEGFVASAALSPILNGGAYTNYDTIFYHGSLAGAEWDCESCLCDS